MPLYFHTKRNWFLLALKNVGGFVGETLLSVLLIAVMYERCIFSWMLLHASCVVKNDVSIPFVAAWKDEFLQKFTSSIAACSVNKSFDSRSCTSTFECKLKFYCSIWSLKSAGIWPHIDPLQAKNNHLGGNHSKSQDEQEWKSNSVSDRESIKIKSNLMESKGI